MKEWTVMAYPRLSGSFASRQSQWPTPSWNHNVLRCFWQVLLTSAVQIITAELVRIHEATLSPYKQPLTTCVSPYYLVQSLGEAMASMNLINRSSKLAGMLSYWLHTVIRPHSASFSVPIGNCPQYQICPCGY